MTKGRNIEMISRYRKKARKFIRPDHLRSLIIFSFLMVSIALATVSYLGYQIGYKVGSHQFSSYARNELRGITNLDPDAYFKQEVDIGTADFSPFWDAWVLLEKNFVNGSATSSSEKATAQDRIWGAISGLTASYGDPFTTFLPPEEAASFESSIAGEFTGVGIEITNRRGLLMVVAPLPGTPAYRAGVRAKDVISAIDDQESITMSAEKAVELIRGPKGKKVKLELLREGETEPIVVNIVRDRIEIPTIQTQVIDNAYIIKLYSFSAQAASQFEDALIAFNRGGYNKLVIDLRNNPGGLLEAAVDIASQFLESDELVVTEKYSDEINSIQHYSYGYNRIDGEVDVLVLINGGSASAAEILAGALRDNNRALLGGEQSFGKGSVQELFQLTKDTSLKITIAKWLSPSGVDISKNGLTPDIAILPQENEDDTSEINAGTFNQDFAQDSVIMDAIAIIKRNDYQDFFIEVPDKYKIQVK
ncbi:MAG: S41 family peptidase [Patescibacteria group bacterium]